MTINLFYSHKIRIKRILRTKPFSSCDHDKCVQNLKTTK